ncbi:hyccin [Leptopilina boulardi]|uniref:hyccin n=1 Tax=Leptopilina boulardi TaxID=63433 RepID=UPI0021F5D7C0|nr:hyccin [Leptopilina boulardi]
MTESVVTEWLADCVDLSSAELHSFASTLSEDTEIVRAIYILLEERTKYCQLVDTVCNKLFDFYRSQEKELERFTLQFLPTLIYIYLNSVAHGDIKNCRTVETLLIGLYNLEVVDMNGQPKVVSFRLPSLAMLSIYHEPSSLASASLTESAIRRFEECNSKLVSWGPLQQVEILNAQNRLKVMTSLLFIYNQQLSFISKHSLEQLCKVATTLVTQGFSKLGLHQRSSYNSETSFVPRLLPRIPVTNQFLLEFLHSIYFAMYNDCWYVANQATDDIHNRACYETFTNVMLVTNAIRNANSSGPPGQLGDNSLGIAISSSSTGTSMSKSMITNASFRTKKLPDDIPIQVTKEEGGTENKSNLKSITEDQEISEPNRAGSVRQSKDTKVVSKITNFSGLGKKPKEKDGKGPKNLSGNELKEKKFGSQGILKDSTKGSRSILNNDQEEMDTIVNGTRKKIIIGENNLTGVDANTSLIESERLTASNECAEGINLDSSVSLTRTYNDTESGILSMQVSTV